MLSPVRAQGPEAVLDEPQGRISVPAPYLLPEGVTSLLCKMGMF